MDFPGCYNHYGGMERKQNQDICLRSILDAHISEHLNVTSLRTQDENLMAWTLGELAFFCYKSAIEEQNHRGTPAAKAVRHTDFFEAAHFIADERGILSQTSDDVLRRVSANMAARFWKSYLAEALESFIAKHGPAAPCKTNAQLAERPDGPLSQQFTLGAETNATPTKPCKGPSTLGPGATTVPSQAHPGGQYPADRVVRGAQKPMVRSSFTQTWGELPAPVMKRQSVSAKQDPDPHDSPNASPVRLRDGWRSSSRWNRSTQTWISVTAEMTRPLSRQDRERRQDTIVKQETVEPIQSRTWDTERYRAPVDTGAPSLSTGLPLDASEHMSKMPARDDAHCGYTAGRSGSRGLEQRKTAKGSDKGETDELGDEREPGLPWPGPGRYDREALLQQLLRPPAQGRVKAALCNERIQPDMEHEEPWRRQQPLSPSPPPPPLFQKQQQQLQRTRAPYLSDLPVNQTSWQEPLQEVDGLPLLSGTWSREADAAAAMGAAARPEVWVAGTYHESQRQQRQPQQQWQRHMESPQDQQTGPCWAQEKQQQDLPSAPQHYQRQPFPPPLPPPPRSPHPLPQQQPMHPPAKPSVLLRTRLARRETDFQAVLPGELTAVASVATASAEASARLGIDEQQVVDVRRIPGARGESSVAGAPTVAPTPGGSLAATVSAGGVLTEPELTKLRRKYDKRLSSGAMEKRLRKHLRKEGIGSIRKYCVKEGTPWTLLEVACYGVVLQQKVASVMKTAIVKYNLVNFIERQTRNKKPQPQRPSLPSPSSALRQQQQQGTAALTQAAAGARTFSRTGAHETSANAPATAGRGSGTPHVVQRSAPPYNNRMGSAAQTETIATTTRSQQPQRAYHGSPSSSSSSSSGHTHSDVDSDILPTDGSAGAAVVAAAADATTGMRQGLSGAGITKRASGSTHSALDRKRSRSASGEGGADCADGGSSGLEMRLRAHLAKLNVKVLRQHNRSQGVGWTLLDLAENDRDVRLQKGCDNLQEVEVVQRLLDAKLGPGNQLSSVAKHTVFASVLKAYSKYRIGDFVAAEVKNCLRHKFGPSAADIATATAVALPCAGTGTNADAGGDAEDDGIEYIIID